MDLAREFKDFFKSSNVLVRLLVVNIAIYLLIQILYVVFFLFQVNESLYYSVIQWLSVPADLLSLVFRPWTLITYMFLHEGFWHILGNMLWLFFLGKIFLMFIDEKKMFAVYILGGLSGAFLYILAYNIFPAFNNVYSASVALGASASVTAIVMAISVYQPNFQISLFGIIPIRLKWIALFFVLYDIISIPKGNAGGHLAHLGGAIFGFIFAMQLQKRNDITAWFSKFIANIQNFFKPKPQIKVTYKNPDMNRKMADDMHYNQAKRDTQAEIDRILDKISKTGYDSLSKDEKDFLFKFSQRD